MTDGSEQVRRRRAAGVTRWQQKGERDRFGRLVAFLARAVVQGALDPVGIGVDERTALVVGADGTATVLGRGRVYLIFASGTPERVEAGAPLSWSGLGYLRLEAGDEVSLPPGASGAPRRPLAVRAGQLDPDDPYRAP